MVKAGTLSQGSESGQEPAVSDLALIDIEPITAAHNHLGFQAFALLLADVLGKI